MKNIFRLIRPTHWIKNFFVFMPLFFGGAITDISMLTNAVIAFIAFSFIASAIYCYNDIIDVEDDRRHSVKRHRPIASGAVSVSAAYLIMIVMILISISTAMLAGSRWCSLATVIAIYFLMEIAYCRIHSIGRLCVAHTGRKRCHRHHTVTMARTYDVPAHSATRTR